TADWSTPCAVSSPSSVRACTSSLPSTLTNTFAWCRSGLVATPVTVTKPIRGSLSVGTASDRTCRIDSFTRRMRSVIEAHQFSLRPHELPFLPGEVALSAVEELDELGVPSGDARDGQA